MISIKSKNIDTYWYIKKIPHPGCCVLLYLLSYYMSCKRNVFSITGYRYSKLEHIGCVLFPRTEYRWMENVVFCVKMVHIYILYIRTLLYIPFMWITITIVQLYTSSFVKIYPSLKWKFHFIYRNYVPRTYLLYKCILIMYIWKPTIVIFFCCWLNAGATNLRMLLLSCVYAVVSYCLLTTRRRWLRFSPTPTFTSQHHILHSTAP